MLIKIILKIIKDNINKDFIYHSQQ